MLIIYIFARRDSILTTDYIQNEKFKQCIENIFGGTQTENAMFTYVRIYNSTNGFEDIDEDHPDVKAFQIVYKQFIQKLFEKMKQYKIGKRYIVVLHI